MPRHLRISSAAAFICVTLYAVPGVAQSAELRSRVDGFVTALREMEPMEKIASFFPRRGVWEFVETPDKVAPGARVGRRRFGPEHTLTAIREGGPLCNSFGGVRGDVGAHEGALVTQVQANERRWVHAGGNRFVPPGKSARSPIFLEWMREDGRWVIARVGEESWYSPRVLRDPGWPVVRRNLVAGTGLPIERTFATTTRWYADHLPIRVHGRVLNKYGLARALGADEVERFGSVGLVPIFVERGVVGSPEVVYALTGIGEYQPYQNMTNSTCRD
jgi:hypothetical protein